MSTASNDYAPPVESLGVLGTIVELLKSRATQRLDCSRFENHPAKHICKLPDGTLYFENENDVDVDDDGFTTRPGTIWPSWRPPDWVATPPHQESTSYGGVLGQPEAWSAFLHQYIALPGSLRAGGKIWWRAAAGLTIGDGAIVIKGSQWIPCVFVDTGPGDKIGEMSLAAHARFRAPETLFETGSHERKLGTLVQRDEASRWVRDKVSRTTNKATPGPFITLVFPGTSSHSPNTTTLFAEISAKFQEYIPYAI